MPLSRSVARFNRRITNRLAGHIAGWLPGFAIVIHTGRRSGQIYRTPVNAFRGGGGGYRIALTYGADSDWVRNVMAAGGCTLEVRRRHIALTHPRIVNDPSRRWAPPVVRQVLGTIDASQYLQLTRGDGRQSGPARPEDRDAGAEADVLIVGAGPTGLTLAIQLGRFGIPCRIVDTAPAPTDKSKAIAIQARTLERFATMGVAEAIVAAGLRGRGLDFFADRHPLGGLRFTSDVETPYPYMLFLDQSQTERLLIERLTGLGIHVERGVTLTGFVQDTAGVSATLRHPDDREEMVRCRWLVGCDGAHSAVRHGLSLPFEGSAYEQTYWLADVQVQWPLDHDVGRAFLGERRSLFAFPIPEANRYRLIAQPDDVGLSKPGDPTLADMQQLMDALSPESATLSDPVWLTAFHLHHRKVTRYRVGRVFVAGDAAHIHSPAGGQGMNTGIQDADNLAWKLALVAQGKADPALLESYHIERDAIGAQVLRQTDLMFRLVPAQSPVLRAIRDRLIPLLLSQRALTRQMQKMIGELGIHYPKSPFVAEDGRRGGPQAGTYAPDSPLAIPSGAATSLWSLLAAKKSPQHTALLLSGPRPTAEDFSRLAAIREMVATTYGDLIAIRLIVAGSGAALDALWGGLRYDDPDLALHTRYRAKGPALYLIRPDGYIGFRSQPANGDALRDYLRSIFIPAAR